MKKLLFSISIHDCEVQTFCTGGKGGQNQNKREMGVRVIHIPSGAVGECREERHQLPNKQRAFRRMAETKTFQNWHKIECARRLGHPSIDQLVEDALDPRNIKTEVKNEEGKWEVEHHV